MEAKKKILVAEKRNYLVKTTKDAKQIVKDWLTNLSLEKVTKLGLPEIDDRYNIWRVPILDKNNNRIGESVIDAFTTELDELRTTKQTLLESRLLKKDERKVKQLEKQKIEYPISNLRNSIGLGDCKELLDEMPSNSVDLIFTSPPYFNARPQYSEYEEYEHYLNEMRLIIRKCARVLNEGRFFVFNISHVLIRRASRNEASKRLAVPFDMHRIFIEEGFEFIDDIHWLKPEGAGWATGRGRRFAADRNPLQYKAVPVTEYVLVYRKKSKLLIDWFIRNHPDKNIIANSKVKNGYEKTNVWKINPKTNSKHPAPFPIELATKVIEYYSFVNDVVLDPFGGSGTTALAAANLNRRFVIFEIDKEYMNLIKKSIESFLKNHDSDILYINTDPIHTNKS